MVSLVLRLANAVTVQSNQRYVNTFNKYTNNGLSTSRYQLWFGTKAQCSRFRVVVETRGCDGRFNCL